MAQNNSLLNMATANPVSTDVHNNINDLIMKAEMNSKLKQYSMSAYKQPQPITGTAPDIALNPLLAAKKIPSLMKLLKKINLRNPIYHHTNIPKAKKILETQKIKATGASPKSDISNKYAFSITRDPKFLSRDHFNIGTDVRFIMDRDDLVKKGYKILPHTDEGFRKSLTTDADFPFVKNINPTTQSVRNPEYYKKIYGRYPEQMNPRFEFEERILGNLPTKDIKLMDFTKIPIEYGTTATGKYFLQGARKPTLELQNLINTVLDMNQKSTKLPVVMSEQVRSTLKKVEPYLMDMYTKNNPDLVKALERLMSSPTYKYNPFKLKNK
jgi:hypothetical protein